MTSGEQYDHDQQELAREMAHRLRTLADKASSFMVDHAISTAFLGTGVAYALRHMSPAEVAEWLQSIADEIVKPDAGAAGHA